MRILLATLLCLHLAGCRCERADPPGTKPASQVSGETVVGEAAKEPESAGDDEVARKAQAIVAHVAELETAFDGDLPLDDPKNIAAHIDQMYEVDQYVRFAVTNAPREDGFSQEQVLELWDRVGVKDIDRRNTDTLKALIAHHGWATIAEASYNSGQRAWLLVQHADDDRDFQRRVLTLMKPLLGQPGVEAKHYGYLFDRVASGEKKPQRYGTQGSCVGPGKWQPHAMEDPDNVDHRRREIGLEPMAEYMKYVAEMCP